jgi:urease accessory protein
MTLIVANPVSAHTGTGLAGGLVSGLEHPLTGADHLLAMVAVGVWGAFLGRPLVFALPIIFPVVMVCGAVLGMIGVSLPPVEIGIALSVMILGICIALPLSAPIPIASAIVAIFAIFHGYAHGRELPSAADPIGYSAGFVLATGLLHVLGIGIGLLSNLPVGMTAIRGLGGAIAAAGVWFFCKAIGS